MPANPPLSARELYENREFNSVKRQMPHLTSQQIQEYIHYMWKFSTPQEVKDTLKVQAQASFEKYAAKIEEVNRLK